MPGFAVYGHPDLAWTLCADFVMAKRRKQTNDTMRNLVAGHRETVMGGDVSIRVDIDSTRLTTGAAPPAQFTQIAFGKAKRREFPDTENPPRFQQILQFLQIRSDFTFVGCFQFKPTLVL